MVQKSGDHHLGCKIPANNGIFTISTGAGFLPSTVSQGLTTIDTSSLSHFFKIFLCDSFGEQKHKKNTKKNCHTVFMAHIFYSTSQFVKKTPSNPLKIIYLDLPSV